MVQDTPTTYSNQLTRRESRQARKGLLGTAEDPLGAGQALAKIGGFYEGGLGRLAQYRKGNTDQMTYTTPEMQAALGQYQQYAQKYSNGGRSGDMQSVLNRHKAGLEGYSSAESQGFREQAQRGIDTQFKTGLAQQRIAQARGGVRGASAAAQAANLNRSRIGEQQTLEQDLFIKNADEKQRRLAAYGETLSGAEGDEYNRMMQTQTAYSNLLGGQEQANRDSSKYDLDRLMAERSGALSSVLTAADTRQAKESERKKLELWRQALNRGRTGPAM